MTLYDNRRGCRGGYTLMELLIVIVIMITLVSIALPVAKKVMEDAGPKEASRQLSAFFALAKARAAESGRPWGVWIECSQPLGGITSASAPVAITNVVRQATKFYLAEVPEHYTGDVLNATARLVPQVVYGQSYPNGPGPWQLEFGNSGNDGASFSYLAGKGSEFFIRFNYAGSWFRGFVDNSGNIYVYGPGGRDMSYGAGYLSAGSDDIRPPLPPVNSYLRFQIIREPKRVNNTIELSSGTCVDLVYSGMGPSGVDFSGFVPGFSFNSGTPINNPVGANTTNPVSFYQTVVVMFSPGGAVDSVYCYLDPTAKIGGVSVPASSGFYGQFPPQGTVHFLIGKVEKVNFPVTALTGSTPDYQRTMFDPEQSNLADPKSLWLSIARTTGSITTSENVPPQYVSTSGTRLTYQAIDVNGGSPIQIDSAAAQKVGSIYGRPAFVEMSRSVATGLQQIGGP